MKNILLSTLFAFASLYASAQPAGAPAGGFGGFQVPEVKLETSQQWKDINYAGDDKAYHTCDIYLPAKKQESYPVVIHIYGSAWFSNNSKGAADLGTIVKSLLEAGYAVVCPNHRSSVDAHWPAQIHDIKAVIRFVRGEATKYKFDTSFIATSGFSSGGHLSSMAATTSGTPKAQVQSVAIDLEGNVGNYTGQSSRVDAACDWSGPVDLTNMDCGEHMTMGDKSPEDVLLDSKLSKEPDKYLSLSAVSYIDKNDPPVIIFHGEKDNVVPCCQGKKFFELLKAAGVKTEATFVPEGGHGFNMYDEANLKKMVNFLNTVKDKKKLKSPNGKVEVAVSANQLQIFAKGKSVSRIGNIGNYSKIDSIGTVLADYQMLIGKRRHCTNQAQEYVLSGNDQSRRLIIRVYNNGVAFRYAVDGVKSAAVPAENTTIELADGTPRYMMKWSDSYEDFYPLSTQGWSQGDNRRWAFPMLIHPSDDVWALFSEADVEAYNSAACLYNKENANIYNITPDDNDVTYCGNWQSPWRVIITGDLSDIVSSTLITDVATPCKLEDTSWIHPGVVSWVYWAYNHGSNDYQIVKKYVDMAATLHLPYVLIDAEWDEMKNGGTIEDALKYAREKGVKPIIWYNSCIGWINGAPGPKWRLNDADKREKEFEWCEKNGVAGVKIDFFSGDTQANMTYCIDLLKSAARHHLLVNFHGATIPRGWSRTYPNLITTEAVYGAEWYNNNERLTNRAAAHNATLPFTRNVIGPMDYTPCTFSDSQHPHITTDAHELALTVLFESGLQHLADKPESYLQPKYADVQKFFTQLPVAWDDTQLLSGVPGEYVVMARKSGNRWYIAGINGTDKPMTIKLNAEKLKLKGKKIIFSDGENTSLKITSKALPKTINCNARGGFVIY